MAHTVVEPAAQGCRHFWVLDHPNVDCVAAAAGAEAPKGEGMVGWRHRVCWGAVDFDRVHQGMAEPMRCSRMYMAQCKQAAGSRYAGSTDAGN